MSEVTLCKYGQEIIKTVARSVEHRKEMCSIIVDDLSDKEKLVKIRLSILKYNAYKEESTDEESTDDEELKVEEV